MTVRDIPTEMLVKLRERFLSGRARLSMLTQDPAWLREFERGLIEALEKELRRRLH
jgi:hypothetical protein